MTGKQEISNRRVWEIDAFRGLLIILLLCWHLYYTVEAFCIDGYYQIDTANWLRITDPLHIWFVQNTDGSYSRAHWIEIGTYTIESGVVEFFLMSGISCVFSRNNLKRAVKTLIGGFFIAGFTKCLAIWTGDPSRFIRFGILMCYAFCQFAFVFIFEKWKNKAILPVSILIILVGYALSFITIPATRLPFLYIFGVPQLEDASSDNWPVVPYLGWFLMGAILGRKLYPEKKSLLPNPFAEKITKPLQWCGRHSGMIYIAHIVIYTAVFCGIGFIFHLL